MTVSEIAKRQRKHDLGTVINTGVPDADTLAQLQYDSIRPFTIRCVSRQELIGVGETARILEYNPKRVSLHIELSSPYLYFDGSAMGFLFLIGFSWGQKPIVFPNSVNSFQTAANAFCLGNVPFELLPPGPGSSQLDYYSRQSITFEMNVPHSELYAHNLNNTADPLFLDDSLSISIHEGIKEYL